MEKFKRRNYLTTNCF